MLGEADGQIRLTNRSGYGRPVATVTVKGRDLGETLIRARLAIPQPEFLKTDPARAKQYNEDFHAPQKSKAAAFAGKRIAPVTWRRGHRLACARCASSLAACRDARGSAVRRGCVASPPRTRTGLPVPQPEYRKTDPARAKQDTEAFAASQRSKAGAFACQWIEPVRWRRGDRLACGR